MAEPIVDTVISVRADTSKMEADVNAAKAKVESGTTGADAAAKATAATQAQAAATATLGDKLKAVKKTYGEQIEVVQGLIGKIAAIGAIAGVFYKIGEAITTHVIDRLATAKQRMEDFRGSLDKTNIAASQVKIADKFDELNQQLYEVETQFRPLTKLMLALFPNLAGLVADDARKIRAEIEGLNTIAAATANNARRIRAVAQAEKDAKAADEFRKTATDAVRATMADEEKIKAEAEDKIRTIKAQYNAQNAADRAATEQQSIDAVIAAQQEAATKIAKIQEDRRKDEEQKRKEADAKRYQEENLLATLDEQGRLGRQRIDDERQKRRESFADFQANIAEITRKQEEAASKVRESWSQTFRQIREENNRAFATDQAASMVQFAQQMKMEGIVASANMNTIVVQGVG